jgi:type IV pilus assembly protein PilX
MASRISRAAAGGARREGGAILITALLMLLTLTVLGISVVQMSRMQERMAGNTRDLNISFQGAEAALRAGEAVVDVPAAATLIPCAGAGCVQPRDTLPLLADQAQAWWDTNGSAFAGLPSGGSNGGPANNPQYVVEELNEGDQLMQSVEDQSLRFFYQVTARSTGASGSTNTVLQTTFAKPR